MPELRIALTPKQSEFDRALQTTENVFYGGARGGGKSHGLREIWLKRRIEIPNSYGVIFRKTYPELYGNHIDPLLQKFPSLRDWWSNQHKELRFPNGSVLAFRYCQHESDLGLHQGQEYHDLGIDEVGDWPEHWFWTLKASNRSARPGIRPRCGLTGNPGGIGHKWLKRLFIVRAFKPTEDPAAFAFVQAFAEDNPALMEHDPGYTGRLEANPNKLLVRAWRRGDWDLQAGQFFDMLTRETHMVEPFEIPAYWQRGGAFDWGFNHPAAFGWFAMDTDGNAFMYREHVCPGQRVEEIVEHILSFPDSLRLAPIPAGWDCWVKHGTGPSVEESWLAAARGKLVLEKATIDRVPGAQQVRDYLVVRENGPRLRFFNTCPITFDCLTRMTHDIKKPEDVLKVDAVEGDPWTGDDPYDMIRHFLMSRPQIAVEPAKPQRRKYYEKSDVPPVNWKTV